MCIAVTRWLFICCSSDLYESVRTVSSKNNQIKKHICFEPGYRVWHRINRELRDFALKSYKAAACFGNRPARSLKLPEDTRLFFTALQSLHWAVSKVKTYLFRGAYATKQIKALIRDIHYDTALKCRKLRRYQNLKWRVFVVSRYKLRARTRIGFRKTVTTFSCSRYKSAYCFLVRHTKVAILSDYFHVCLNSFWAKLLTFWTFNHER